MTQTPQLSFAQPLHAFDAVLVEYRTIRLRPRLVFDHLTRTAFEACAALADEIFTAQPRSMAASSRAQVRCGIRTDEAGAYRLSFEIPVEESSPGPRGVLGRLLSPTQDRGAHDTADDLLQFELLTATRIIEDMLLAVDTVCTVPPSHLSVWADLTGPEGMIGFLDGIKVVRRIHRCSWDLLVVPEIQALLRETLAPFRDPELYTMGVKELTPLGCPGSNWVMTANRRLCGFAAGGRLELPELEEPRSFDDLLTRAWG